MYAQLKQGATPSPPPTASQAGLSGQAIGPYRVVEKLGAGGMAEVYKAYQPRLDRYVALKFIRPELLSAEDFRPRFEREAKTLAQLSHPNIIHVYDFGEEGRHCYLAMEYVAGGTLKEWLRSLSAAGQVMSLEQALAILQQVSAGLDYAHQQGVIHRDIKPANIMLTADGRALLNDFGIAKVISTSRELTQTGSTTGTPAYMSPEQISGGADKIGSASDLYSLGVVLYELVTGQTPFSADTPMGLMLKQVKEPPPPPRSLNPTLPEPAERVILRALAKDPAERYQRAGELAQAFQQAIRAASSPAPADSDLTATLRRGTWWPQFYDDAAPAPGEPPFKGLHYFDEADADLFFGRELLTARLVTRLTPISPNGRSDGEQGSKGGFTPAPLLPITPAHFLAIVGASGSGKSSLVRAGLVPILRRREPLSDGSLPPESSSHWPIHIITPTAHPLESLAASLTRDSESVTATATLMDDLAHDPRSLHLYVRRLLDLSPSQGESQGGGRLLLVVDQFEELFTLCRDEMERRAFVDNLLMAADISSKQESRGVGEQGRDFTPAPLHPRSPATFQDGPTLVVIT
ncbi:MAG: serine/threonine-protein kinase PknK, partial [Chloroflexi bacterium]|nr:serine/threonine-protein kinase PknK [Chloroflexota bacterium]